MREAFERAILDSPDEATTYAAYADWLQEQDDPRGEFMRVQLALEDESLPKGERDQLKAREAELLKEHEREWLGELAPHAFANVDQSVAQSDPNYDWNQHDWNQPRRPTVDHTWRRGVLAELKVDCLTVSLAQSLLAVPPFVQKFHVASTAAYLSMEDDTTPRRVPPTSEHRGDEWLELRGARFLDHVRVFQMGDHDYSEPPEDGWSDNHTYAHDLDRVIADMPRVEELHLLCKEYDAQRLFGLPNLTHLRVLRMYAFGDPYDGDGVYPLATLANNPAVGNLTHLLMHPHGFRHESFIPLAQVHALVNSPYLKKLTHLQLRLSDMGDDGVRAIIASGILKQLKWLDLRHGCVTDEGAGLFAKCPATRNLDRLDLSRNAVSAEGLRALRKAKINAVANRPLTEQELTEREYLREGDFE